MQHFIRSVLLFGVLPLSIFFTFPQHLLGQVHDSLFVSPNDISQRALLQPTEIHIGLGSQNLFYGGIRQKIFHSFLVEANLGYLNWPTLFESYTYEVGLSWIPVSTQANPGFIGGLLFFEWGDNSLFKNKFINYRILTGNIGYLIQHNVGLSFLGRAGIGVQQQNSHTWDYNLNRNVPQTTKYLAWLNFEITVGFTCDFSPSN